MNQTDLNFVKSKTVHSNSINEEGNKFVFTDFTNGDEYRNNSEIHTTFMKKSSKLTKVEVESDSESEVALDQTAKFSGAFNAQEDNDIE